MFDVFANEIGLQVHRVARFSFAQRGHLVSVRDDPDAETFPGDAGHGEAHAIHGNGAFEDDVAQHVRRRGDFQDVIRAGPFPASDAARAVDVAGDEMAAEAAVGGERTFEVHERTDMRRRKVGSLPGFAEQIEMQQRAPARAGNFRDRQAAAVDLL